MIHRIELILKTKNLTPTQFADAVGIQRSSLSHILSGRNNPSLDFVMKVITRFPDLQTDWLMFGKGPMYKEVIAPSKPVVKSLFDETEDFPEINTPAPLPSNESYLFDKEDLNEEETTEELPKEENSAPTAVKKDEKTSESAIEKIIIFFKDGHFKVYE